MKTVPTIRLSHLSDDDKRVYILRELWLNHGHGHGTPAERKMAMVIGRPLVKLNASTRGPRS
jgi:hypothetical protein